MQKYLSKSNSKMSWGLFFSLMFVLFLQSMHVYFFWNTKHFVQAFTAVFICFFVLKNLNYFSFNKKNAIPFFLFFITLLYTIRFQNINGFIGAILPFVSLFFIFSLKKIYKAKFLENLTKTLSILLSVSLFVWILVQLGVPFPKSTITYLASGTLYYLDNYYVFIEYQDILNYPRFMSIFIEPGYLGALLAILIYVNNFEFRRKEVLVMFLSLIFTFSIAGYLMLVVGYFSFLLSNKKNVFKYLFFSLMIIAISYSVLIKIVDKNALNTLVKYRMEFDNEKGLSGNNRTDSQMDVMFEQFLKSDDVLTGIGENYVHFGSNVGYKPFIIIHGLIGLSLLLLSYLSGWYYSKCLFSLTISVFYFMIFYKGHSEIFWAGYLMTYATSIYLPKNWREVYIKEK